ncbi:MAG: ABC transporter permease [Ignavibacteriales bacterium]|nr:ABC transporter permease [Ignavibacteriales bacterium]
MKFVFDEFKEGMAIAFAAIRANKMRSVLTTLGIVIGIVSVTLMGTAIEGLDRAFNKSIAALGTDVLYVQKFPWIINDDDFWKLRNRKDILIQHAKAIEKNSEYASAVNPVIGTLKNVKYGQKLVENVVVVGTGSDMLETSGATVAFGRFFTRVEADGGRPVCALGSEVAANLFPNENPIGKIVKIGGYLYHVSGVFDKQGNFLGSQSLDNRVYVPINRFFKEFMSFRGGIQIWVKAKSVGDLDETKEEVRGIMRKTRGLKPKDRDDFAINQQEILVQTFNQIGGVIAAVGLFVTGMSLFVGGIGIMNIMFVSVTERTREIGIRKAIGAPRRTILLQFLMESAALCLIGGIIGIIIAFPISLIIDTFLPTAMPLSVVAFALVVSIIVGIVSGFLPAYRASRLDPVDALRYE